MTQRKFATNADGVAIDGYDPIAYFADGAAQRGSARHVHHWSGATWHFTSSEHAEQFAADPERYAPQFGGQCAFGASLGKDADASPESWRIIDGRLCLMKSGSVRALSRLVTSKIADAITEAN